MFFCMGREFDFRPPRLSHFQKWMHFSFALEGLSFGQASVQSLHNQGNAGVLKKRPNCAAGRGDISRHIKRLPYLFLEYSANPSFGVAGIGYRGRRGEGSLLYPLPSSSFWMKELAWGWEEEEEGEKEGEEEEEEESPRRTVDRKIFVSLSLPKDQISLIHFWHTFFLPSTYPTFPNKSPGGGSRGSRKGEGGGGWSGVAPGDFDQTWKQQIGKGGGESVRRRRRHCCSLWRSLSSFCCLFKATWEDTFFTHALSEKKKIGSQIFFLKKRIFRAL